MRIVISGGGTGGHIFPGLAVCESLRRLDEQGALLYIGSASGMEADLVPPTGIPFQAVSARKLRKLLSPGTLAVAWSLLKGYQEARAHLRAFRAEAVVGTGGYVAAAAVLAGARLGLPSVILAPDRVPGRTNRQLARFVRRVCLVFPETAARFPKGKTVVTGLPLRAGIVAPPEITPSNARCRFPGLEPDRFTVLIIGGSQGAQAINARILGAAPDLLATGIQILHQTGPKNLDAVRSEAERQGLLQQSGYVPQGFLTPEQVSLAMRAADIIVCRGGISTLSEATANGLPALVLPLPSAYADHQTANARALEDAGAGLLCPEAQWDSARLSATLVALRTDSLRRQKMAQASRAMGRPHAADAVARLVLEGKLAA